VTEATPQDQGKIKRGLRVWLAYFMLSFLGYSLNVAGPAVAYLREELNFSYTESGLHTSALALGLVVTGLLGHHLLRRIPEWKALGFVGNRLGGGGRRCVSGGLTQAGARQQ
jgi:MFS family permease